jgi:hypothetical protein
MSGNRLLGGAPGKLGATGLLGAAGLLGAPGPGAAAEGAFLLSAVPLGTQLVSFADPDAFSTQALDFGGGPGDTGTPGDPGTPGDAPGEPGDAPGDPGDSDAGI